MGNYYINDDNFELNLLLHLTTTLSDTSSIPKHNHDNVSSSSTISSNRNVEHFSFVNNDTITSFSEDDLDDVQLFQGYSTTLLRFASICCVLFMFVGIPGNLITIIALFRCKKVIFLYIFKY